MSNSPSTYVDVNSILVKLSKECSYIIYDKDERRGSCRIMRMSRYDNRILEVRILYFANNQCMITFIHDKSYALRIDPELLREVLLLAYMHFNDNIMDELVDNIRELS